MSIADYAQYNEEAAIIWAQENDFNSPLVDMTDEEIKQHVYDTWDDDEFADYDEEWYDDAS